MNNETTTNDRAIENSVRGLMPHLSSYVRANWAGRSTIGILRSIDTRQHTARVGEVDVPYNEAAFERVHDMVPTVVEEGGGS